MADEKIYAVPEGIAKLDICCFRNTNVEEVVLPSTLCEIGDAVFQNCKRLRRVTFSENSALRYLGVNAFNGCDSL